VYAGSLHWQSRNPIPLCGSNMEEGKNCAFMSGDGLHIVLAEPMFSINGFSRVQVGTFFGPHFQFFQELNTTLSESTPRKFEVHVESTLYPSI